MGLPFKSLEEAQAAYDTLLSNKADQSALDIVAQDLSNLASANTGDQQGSAPTVTFATVSAGTLVLLSDVITKVGQLVTAVNALGADDTALRSSLSGAGLLP